MEVSWSSEPATVGDCTIIDHYFYSCGSVTQPTVCMNGSETASDLVLIQTSLLFLCACRLVSITTTRFT